MHLDLPRAGEEGPRILHVHREAGAARVLVDEQHTLPFLAAVARAEDAALLLRAGDPSARAREDDVRIRRMHDDARDASGFVEARMRPRLAGVQRLVDAVADDVAVTDHPRFAGAGPDN